MTFLVTFFLYFLQAKVSPPLRGWPDFLSLCMLFPPSTLPEFNKPPPSVVRSSKRFTPLCSSGWFSVLPLANLHPLPPFFPQRPSQLELKLARTCAPLRTSRRLPSTPTPVFSLISCNLCLSLKRLLRSSSPFFHLAFFKYFFFLPQEINITFLRDVTFHSLYLFYSLLQPTFSFLRSFPIFPTRSLSTRLNVAVHWACPVGLPVYPARAPDSLRARPPVFFSLLYVFAFLMTLLPFGAESPHQSLPRSTPRCSHLPRLPINSPHPLFFK